MSQNMVRMVWYVDKTTLPNILIKLQNFVAAEILYMYPAEHLRYLASVIWSLGFIWIIFY